MLNPQLDSLTWRQVFVGREHTRPNYSGIEWTETPMVDLKTGDMFKLIDPDGTQVQDENGKNRFIAASNGYINEMGIPEVRIHE